MDEPHRKRLPDTRESITHKSSICGFEVYATVGFYDDTDCPAELFTKLSKHGSEMSGLLDGISVMISIALQYGVPWVKIRDKFKDVRFGIPDETNKSLLDGLVQVVDHCIEVRKNSLDNPEPQV